LRAFRFGTDPHDAELLGLILFLCGLAAASDVRSVLGLRLDPFPARDAFRSAGGAGEAMPSPASPGQLAPHQLGVKLE